jgi:DNA ligase (NAD+)
VLGKRKAATIHAAQLDAYRAVPFAVFLTALGIPKLAVTTAQRVAAALGDADALLEVSNQELEAIPEVSRDVAAKIFTALQQRREELVKLLETVTVTQHVRIQGKLSGHVICVTGGRGRLPQLIAEHGGEFTDSLGKRCTMLVLGEGLHGSKVQRAVLMGIPSYTAAEFLERLGIGSA